VGRLLITGRAGFACPNLAVALAHASRAPRSAALNNRSRPASKLNLRCLRDAREHFLYVFKGGSLRSPPAPGCGRPQAAVLAARQPRRRPY